MKQTTQLIKQKIKKAIKNNNQKGQKKENQKKTKIKKGKTRDINDIRENTQKIIIARTTTYKKQ